MAGFEGWYTTKASCPHCGNEFEQQSTSPAEYIMCPKCYSVFDKDGDLKHVMDHD